MSTKTWSNTAGGDWLTDADWITTNPSGPSAHPVAGDAVTIGLTTTNYTVTLASGETADAAASLNVSSATATVALVGNASLTLSSFLTNHGTIDVDTAAGTAGGSLSVTGAVTNSGTMNLGNAGITSASVAADFGSLSNSGHFTTAGASSLVNTAVSVTGAVSNNGTMSIGANSSLTAGGTFTESGISATTIDGTLSAANLTVSGGTFTLDSTGTLTLGATGTLTATSTGKVDLSAASATGFTNLSAAGVLSGKYVVSNGGELDLATVSKLGAGSVTLSGSSSVFSSGGVALSTTLTEIESGGALALNANTDFSGGSALIVDSGASLTLDSTSSIGEGSLTINGTATVAGTINANVTVGSTGTLTLDPSFQLPVGDTVTGSGTALLQMVAASGTTTTHVSLGSNFVGFANVLVKSGIWAIDSTIAAIPTGVTGLKGDNASTTLTMDDAGTFSLATVSQVGKINLADGSNGVTVTNNTLSGGAVTIQGGATAGTDTLDASGVTSSGKTLNFFAGFNTTGDAFTGGTENDNVQGVANALTGDALNGGTGNNTITISGGNFTGTSVDLTNASNFGTISLLAPGGKTILIDDSTLNLSTVTINAIPTTAGNTINASAAIASSTKTLIYRGGKAADTFTGGTEKDVVHVSARAGSLGTLDGGATGGINTLFLNNAGNVDLTSVQHFNIVLAPTGANVVTIGDTTLNDTGTTPVTITDGNGGTTFNSSATLATGSVLFNVGNGTDVFNGGTEADTVRVAAARLGADTFDGGTSAASDTLTLTTSAGTSLVHANLDNVSNFETIKLAGGLNFIDVHAGTLAGSTAAAPLTINGLTSINTITVTGGTSTEGLKYLAGVGADTFDASGSGTNVTVNVNAAALSLAAASFKASTTSGLVNTLNLNTAGAVDLTNATGFNVFNLAAGTNFVKATTTELAGATLSAGSKVGVTNNNTLTLQNAGSLNMASISDINTINLFATQSTGGSTLTGVTGTIAINDAASGNDATHGNSVSVAGASGDIVTYTIAAPNDTFTSSGAEQDIIEISGSVLGSAGAPTLTGSSNANNQLVLTSAGSLSFPVSTVSGFSQIFLAAGNSSVVIADTVSDPFGTTGLTITDGISGNNVVDASGDGSSGGKTLTYNTKNGQDFFLGGDENDVVSAAAAKLAGDILVGGSGTNTLNINTFGTANLMGVRNFDTINLQAGNNNDAVVVTAGTLFSTLHGGSVTINAAASGSGTDTVFGGGGATGEKLIYAAQKRATVYNAGPQTDVFQFNFTPLGGASSMSLANFNPSNDELSFNNAAAAFNFTGTSGSNMSATLVNVSGNAFNGTNLFAYDQTTGNLFYSPGSSVGTEQLVASLTNKPTLTASDFFVT